MTSGRIIFLDGTSGSGRTSIARELPDILDDGVLFHLAADGFSAMRTGRELRTERLDTALRPTGEGRHRSIAALARVGDDIVVDHVLSEPWRLPDCPTVLPSEDVLFAGVHGPPDEPTRREPARGDRPPVSRRTSTIWSTPTATTTWCATPARQALASAPGASRTSSRTGPVPRLSPASAAVI